MSAPRNSNDRCMQDGGGCSVGACADAGTCSLSAPRLDDVVAARPVSAKERPMRLFKPWLVRCCCSLVLHYSMVQHCEVSIDCIE